MSWSGTIYQCLQCHTHYVPEFGPLRCPACQSKEREVVATVPDPAKFIAELLNTRQLAAFLKPYRGPDRCDVCHAIAGVGFYQGSPCVWHSYCATHFAEHRDEDFICETISKS